MALNIWWHLIFGLFVVQRLGATILFPQFLLKPSIHYMVGPKVQTSKWKANGWISTGAAGLD